MKTALGAENHIPWEFRENVVGLVKELKARGYQIVLLEQMQGSVSHDEFEPRFPVCLVVGNEISGVSDELQSLSLRIGQIGELLDEKEMRWLELSEML